MKEEIYRWVKTIAFFYIVFSAVLHLVPDVKYERYIRSFMGILLIYILSTPVFNLFGNGEKLLQEFKWRSDYGGDQYSGKHYTGAGKGNSGWTCQGLRNRREKLSASYGER